MRISDWSSDVCSSDLDSFARQSFLSCGGSSERRSRNAKPNERKPDPGFVPENGDYKKRRHGEDGERHDTQTSRVNGTENSRLADDQSGPCCIAGSTGAPAPRVGCGGA